MKNTQTKTIIACIDGSKFSTSISEYGAFFSKTLQLPLELLHTVEHSHTPASINLSGNIGLGSRDSLLETLISEEEMESKEKIRKGKAFLETFSQQAKDKGAHSVQTSQRHGNLYETLVEIESTIRVLILGLRGQSHEEETFCIGTQVEEIIRSLHVPILLVNQEFKIPQKVLIAYDGSQSSKKALEMVLTEPLFAEVERHIVNVHKDKNASESLLREACSILGGCSQKNILSISLLESSPMEALLEYQEKNDIDLIAMGAFSHSRLRDTLMGSFTAKILSRTKKPLLLLR